MKDAFYFPHFCNARHDRKLRRVRKELGVEGYGIFFMILEVLRDQADYKYPIEDIDLLADEFGTSEQKLRTVVTNYQLFEVDEEEKFFSSQLIVNLQPFLDGKELKRISGIRGNLIRYKYITKDESNIMNNEDILLKHKELGFNSHSDRKGDRLAIAIKGNKGNKQIKDNIPYGDIIEEFNSICGTSYRSTTAKTRELIKARYNEGFTLDDFKVVIKKKYNEWSNSEMSKYLRPVTLFGTKFESYLNEINNSPQEEKAQSNKMVVIESTNKSINDLIGRTYEQ